MSLAPVCRVKVDLIPLLRDTPRSWMRASVAPEELAVLIAARVESLGEEGWRLVTAIAVSEAVVLVSERIPAGVAPA
jgi:hypothetical protein